MPRTKTYLINEAKTHGLSVNAEMTTAQIMDRLRDHYHSDNPGLLPQIEVMKAKDAAGAKCINFDFSRDDFYNSEYMRRAFWDNSNLIAELKENGVNYKMHLVDTGIRVDSSRRSEAHYAFSEKTDNFQHFKNFTHPKLSGTVLNAEFRHHLAVIDTGTVITASTLASSVAICNSGVETSHQLQATYGPIDAHCFDVLFYKNIDVRVQPRWHRRKLLESIVDDLNHENILLSRECPPHMSKLGFFEWILEHGLEGVMFKDNNGAYESGKRSRLIWKLKKVFTVDAFISGFIPGEQSNTGLVGSVCVSMMTKDGNIREVGAFSNLTDEERRDLTNHQDGSLKKDYYDRVVEIRFFEISKNYRMAHARRTDKTEWRNDKNPHDCIFEEQMQL